MKIFLCGDVMTGRGIDQILPQPCPPTLHEENMHSAIGYLRLAEDMNSAIPHPVDLTYIWGTALPELRYEKPQARIINLETSVTRSDAYERKGINYRMSPENAATLAAAGLDCCLLANNHVLDWGEQGLVDTLQTLEALHIKTAGAGRNLEEAAKPAILDIPGEGRVIVFSFASPSSGTPWEWAAGPDRPGVNLIPALSDSAVAAITEAIAAIRRGGDIIVVSIHWGPNWGYRIAETERRFAHQLIDRAGASIVHGHSSHHPKAIEFHTSGLILYGCGDFLNDYEGISGYEEFRNDLALMYFVRLDRTGAANPQLDMVPLKINRFQLTPAAATDIDWLQATLDRECRKFGTRVLRTTENHLAAFRSGTTRGEAQ